MAKIAEKLTILLETGNGFLIRLYNTKVKYTPDNKERPSFLADPVFAKVVAAFVKRFPEIPSDLDKTPGYEVFLGKAKQIFEELEPDFDTFVDALEWVKITQQTLGDVANATADLTWAYTPVTTEKFLELVTMYCQVNLLWSLIADRRTIATCFARAFNIVRSQNESNFPKVAQYLANYSDPFKKLREDFKSFSKRVGQALVSLLPAYSKLNNLDQLRKEGTLNLTLNPERLALPSHDIAQLDLLNKDKMYTWAIYGHLFCPEELAMPGALDMCRVVLSQAYRTPVFRNVSIPIHNFYSDSWKNFKSKTFKLGKEKKIIVDGLQAATSGAGLIERRNFRIYLRQSLRSLLALLKDFPGLLGPKAVVVWSALAAAKAEVLWYFRHITAPPPKKDKFNEDALRDQHISELLFLTHQLSTLVRQHQRIMQAYYLEYLNEADRKALEDQVRGLPNHATVLPLLRNILGDLQAISVEAFMAGTDYNFDALRLNWARVEASLAAAASTIMPSAVKELIHRGRVICLHTRNVDEIEEQIEQYGSLKSLWYFRDSFVQVFDKSIIDGPANPLNCMAFLHLLAEFPENATGWLPREREVIGPQCVRLAEDMLNKITHRVASIVFEIGKHNLTFASQLNHVNGAHPLLARLKDYKFDKNYVPPTTPGTESHFRNRKELDNLRLYERNVQQLCAAMQDVVDVTIYDTVLTPREYLRDKLVEVLRRFVKKALIIDEQHLLIQRPSILESKLQLFVFTVRLLENYVAMDIASSLREFALGQVFNRHLSDINKIDFSFGDLDLNGPGAGSGSTIGTSISVGLESAVNGVGGGSAGATGPGGLSGGVGFGNDLAHVLSKWYADFMSRRLTTPGICYSVNRKAFISRADVRAVLPFRPEEYADLAELQALVRLVGPYGVRAIHRETMRFVAANIPAIKDVLALNRKVLNDVASSYHRDIAVHLKTLKEVDAFVNRSIAIGNALQFRQLLLEAQRLVAEKEMPYVSRTVANLFDQYPRNTFMKPEFLELDSLAVTLGLDLGSADQALKAVLCKVIGEQDKELWLLLPYMYAVSFVSSKVWAEAIYHPAIEGHANNVHTLSLAINALLIATRATSTSDNEREIIDLMKKFIEASSCILLKQAQQPPRQVEKVVQSLPSVLIFLDKFVEDSPFLQQESLESCLPYALLRSMYKQLYDTRTQGKKGKPVVAPGGGAGAAETAEDGM